MKTIIKKQKCDQRENIIFEFLTIKQSSTLYNEILEPSLEICGRCDTGESIQITTIGFRPYFYFETFEEISEFKLYEIKTSLELLVKNELTKDEKRKRVQVIEKIEQITDRRSVYGYRKENSVFIKLTLSSPKFVTKLRDIVQNNIGVKINGRSSFNTFESDILYTLRWMVDKGCTGGSWLSIDSKKLIKKIELESTCNLEYIVYTDDITILKDKDDHAPFKLLSFDIECTSDAFPIPEKDPVIQIGVTTKIIGKDGMKKYCFNLKGCDQIKDATVFCFDEEKKLLESFTEFLIIEDPDFITGYNIQNFDFPYLYDRAKTLGSKEFPKLSRTITKKCYSKETSFESRAFGKRETKATEIDGRVIIDMIEYFRRNFKLRSYSLNSVSAEFLGDQKADVHHSQIPILHKGTNADRKRLAEYCIKDSELPVRLFEHKTVFYDFFEMCRVTGVPVDFLLSKGQSVKVVTQLYANTATSGYSIPYINKEEINDDDSTSFDGATVVEPIRGFHNTPISTLDFASLYPSIMQAHNLCYTTLLTKEQIKTMDPNDYTKTPTDPPCYFLKAHVKKGILPIILENILAARKRAKKQLEVETDKEKYAILNSKQLALKISANSVYGFTGATVGKLPCLDISASVTAFGREMIKKTSDLVVGEFSIMKGYPANAEILYGDTDSVMVKFGVSTVSEAIELGRKAAKFVSSHFPHPINLEFEKVFYPYLLINKKRYAGLFWTKPEEYDKLDTKGLESVRRDNCLLASKLVDRCIFKLLTESPEAAITHAKETIRKLTMGDIDISQLVITKQLNCDPSEYKQKQPHSQLEIKIKKRSPNDTHSIGDRIPYVYVTGTKKDKSSDLAEDPIYILENGLTINYKYYLENQLMKPLTRIFQYLVKNVNSIFEGEHTRKIVQTLNMNYGIAKFFKVKATCLVCHVSLNGDKKPLCENCMHKKDTIFTNIKNDYENVKKRKEELSLECKNCQKNEIELLCKNNRCPIFYERFSTNDKVIKLEKKLSLEW